MGVAGARASLDTGRYQPVNFKLVPQHFKQPKFFLARRTVSGSDFDC